MKLYKGNKILSIYHRQYAAAPDSLYYTSFYKYTPWYMPLYTTENAAPLIKCEDLSFAYEGHTVVRELNFSVKAGDYLCIIGENGSGKSTLIRGLLGLMNPAGGRIVFDRALKPRDLGYLPQYREARKDFPAGVFEVVLSGRLSLRGLRPFYTGADKKAAGENLARLGIGELRNHSYRELSGGQQQRVLLARALCGGSKLLLLDEPASGLDPLVTTELYRLLAEINRETGTAIVMVSHDIRGAARHASHILHLKNRQLFFGSAGDYRNSETGRNYWGEDGDA
jgi:zinc transport system ATP-binding protein